MPEKWAPAPNAGTNNVALQWQMGVWGSLQPPTSIRRLWEHIGGASLPPMWRERFDHYKADRSPQNKEQLPAINISTICDPKRRVECVTQHTGLVVIDYDKIQKPFPLVRELRKSPHTMGVFVSPSGAGVKAIVPVHPIPACKEDHEAAFQYAVKALAGPSQGRQVDTSGRDPVRLMFAFTPHPFRNLLESAVPVKWYRREPKRAKPVSPRSVDEPTDSDDLRTNLRKLDLSDRMVWLTAMGAAQTGGLSFEEWNQIAAANPGYKTAAEQRRQWDINLRRGKTVPAKAVFAIAKDQGKLTTPSRAPGIRSEPPLPEPPPYLPISGGKPPVSNDSPPKAPSAGSGAGKSDKGDKGDKASTYVVAKTFMKHCDESGEPFRYRPDRDQWWFYGKHGWEKDHGEVHLRERLAEWSEGPAGLALQAPSSHHGRRGVVGDAQAVSWQMEWDETHNVGLPNREVLVLGDSGTIALQKGNAEHYISRRAGASPGVKTKDQGKLWAECLKQWMVEDAVRRYVQIIFGAALVGRAVETRCVFYFQSRSRGGKSTFLGAVSKAMGQYALQAPSKTFMKKYGNDHLTEIARLESARMVISSEIARNQAFDAARIKELSGGEKVAANYMRKDFIEFYPKFLIVLSGNHDPRIAGGESEGMKQRLRIVRWNERGFDKADPEMGSKLNDPAARSAVMQWLVEGAQEYLRNGLPEIPESMVVDSSDYFEHADPLESFCKTLVFGKGEFCPYSTFDTHYSDYADREKIPSDRRLTPRKLHAMMFPLGCRPARERPAPGMKHVRGLRGVRVKTQTELQSESESKVNGASEGVNSETDQSVPDDTNDDLPF